MELIEDRNALRTNNFLYIAITEWPNDFSKQKMTQRHSRQKIKNLIHEYFSAARKEIVMQLKELASHANLLTLEKEIYQTSDD